MYVYMWVHTYRRKCGAPMSAHSFECHACMCIHVHVYTWCVSVLCLVGERGCGTPLDSTPRKAGHGLFWASAIHYELTALIRHHRPRSTVAFSSCVIHTSTLTHNSTVKQRPTHGGQWGQGQHTSVNNQITRRDTHSNFPLFLHCLNFALDCALGWSCPQCTVGTH